MPSPSIQPSSWGVHTPLSALPPPSPSWVLLLLTGLQVPPAALTPSPGSACWGHGSRRETPSSLHSSPRFACLSLGAPGARLPPPTPRPLTCAHVRGELPRLQEEPEVAALLGLHAGHPVAGHGACNWGAERAGGWGWASALLRDRTVGTGSSGRMVVVGVGRAPRELGPHPRGRDAWNTAPRGS